MTSKTDPLIEFLRGRLSWRDLLEEITLPDELWQQMDELWQRSIAHIGEGGYLGQGMSLSRATRYANIDLCQQFDLCFYEGIVFDSLVEEYRP